MGQLICEILSRSFQLRVQVWGVYRCRALPSAAHSTSSTYPSASCFYLKYWTPEDGRTFFLCPMKLYSCIPVVRGESFEVNIGGGFTARCQANSDLCSNLKGVRVHPRRTRLLSVECKAVWHDQLRYESPVIGGTFVRLATRDVPTDSAE